MYTNELRAIFSEPGSFVKAWNLKFVVCQTSAVEWRHYRCRQHNIHVLSKNYTCNKWINENYLPVWQWMVNVTIDVCLSPVVPDLPLYDSEW